MNRREFMTCAICAGLASTVAGARAFAADDDQPIRVGGAQYANRKAFVSSGRRCGTPVPSLYDIRRTQRVRSALRSNNIEFNTKTIIPVHFHIIHDGQAGNLPERQIEDQIALLNQVYAPALLEFQLASVDRTKHPKWYRVGISTPEEAAMKAELGKAPDRSLNFYTADLPDGLLGWATFPWYLGAYPVMDGVVINQMSLPGSAEDSPYNLGMTAVHEIGHWCGLFHTFENGCNDPGDEISDTAYEANSAAGCPLGQKSACENEMRPNPVENYMDYSDDACMKQFTPLQFQRIKDMVGYYRYQLQPAVRRSALLERLREELE
jgi:hypothetical protein